MILPGLHSVTFRHLPVGEIAALASAHGLLAIEWAGDVHAPPGDAAAARVARTAAADHGLTITGYGSYHAAGDDPTDDFAPILDTACRLGAPSIRVWAGRRSSNDSDAHHRAAVIDGLTSVVAQASDAGVTVALEFHAGTLTDTPRGAEDLCTRTGTLSHWQPPVGLDDDVALEGLSQVIPHLGAVHAFSWSATGERLPLAGRADLWRAALAQVEMLPSTHPVLLEFVADDDPANLAQDAVDLLSLTAGASRVDQ